MSSSANSDSSLLLWLSAALVALLAAYLFVGWTRRAQMREGWRNVLGPVLLAASALGLGMSSSMVLALSAEALSFPLGYSWAILPALVLGPMVACIPPAWLLSRRQNWLALGVCGLWLAAVALSVQAGWILAAGLRPGIRWQFLIIGAAAALATVGFISSLWVAYSEAASQSANRVLWRVGAASLIVLTLIAGQEVVISSVGLLTQVGSIYQRQASSTWLCLVAGALLPTLMAALALDLSLRNRADRHRKSRSGVELILPQRRKRRRKYRAL